MILEIVSLTLAVVSVILAMVAIIDSRKINQSTSTLLIEIQTYSKNINDRAMGWVEQLMFNKKNTQEKRENNKVPLVRGKMENISEESILNYLYKEKAATFEDMKKDLNLEFAELKLILKRLMFGSLVLNYQSENDKTIYYLAETSEEAKKKYREYDYSNIPF